MSIVAWGLRGARMPPGFYLCPQSRTFVTGEAPRLFTSAGDAARAKKQIENRRPGFPPMEIVRFELKEI